MSTAHLHDPRAKRILRWGYGAALNLQISATARRRSGGPRLWYGGARIGDVGGTLVKLKRLAARFPEQRWRYNLVYLLSNAPYLPPSALRRLKHRRVPIVLNQNGVFYPAWFDGDWRAMNAIMAQGYQAADHVFWQSGFCREAAERFLGPRQGPGEILFNAVDTRVFVPAGTRPHGAFRFLMTGKLDRHMLYRPQAALEGLAIARRRGLDARILFAGRIDAEIAQAIGARAAELGLDAQIEWRGPYTQGQAPSLYAAADAYLALTFNDACPNAVIEAMACALPVLFNASGGTPELVGGEAGIALQVKPSWERIQLPTADAIAEGMLRIAAGRDAMAAAARARAVAALDIQPWLARHEAVFGALLEGA